MQQTLTEIVDADSATTILRNFALSGSLTGDQLAAFVTLIGSGYLLNDQIAIDVLLAGLDGNDTLTTTINLQNENWETGGDGETITSTIDGGIGDDTITGTINLGIYWGHITNQATGGDGNDVIKLTVQYTNWDDAHGGQLVESVADGGAGNDIIEVRTVVAEWEWTQEPLSHVIHGGSGSDRITSYVKATSNSGDSANVVIFGDKGADTITAYMQLDEGDSHGVTEIHGGAGGDVIVAEVFNVILGGEFYTITTALSGDGGRDRITSLLHMDQLEDFGSSGLEFNITLSGGGGADTLISQGGNELSHNTFDGGSGNDKMFGDGSVDEFLFIANIYQGYDQINNWDGSMDQLNISGLSNAQIDAMSTIASVGADVVLSLDSGTVITFKNVGLAGVDSVSDLFWIGV